VNHSLTSLTQPPGEEGFCEPLLNPYATQSLVDFHLIGLSLDLEHLPVGFLLSSEKNKKS